jgi:hypothetical protein
MPDNQNQGTQPNPFEIVTSGKSKKVGSKGLIITLVIVVFLALGIFAGVLLVRQSQEIREKAACEESCTGNHLFNCTPAEVDGTPDESICDTTGRVASCGGQEYCCSTAGGNWTLNMTVCNATATPTSTATATATSTSTSSASPTATATATATGSGVGGASKTPTPTPTKTSTSTAKATSTSTSSSSATKAPIPETGTSWPTYAGMALGILVIVGALLLAL